MVSCASSSQKAETSSSAFYRLVIDKVPNALKSFLFTIFLHNTFVIYMLDTSFSKEVHSNY
jgi:hypothetical protein